jgi:predicted nucleic acid-binding protein
MIIVDSSVWIDFFFNIDNHHTKWMSHAVGKTDLGLTSITLCEVLQGVRHDSQFRGFCEDLQRFPIFDICSTALSIQSASNYRTLRKRGLTVRKTIDCIIATFCIEQGYELLHKDRDFDPFETHLGLRVIDPAAVSPN